MESYDLPKLSNSWLVAIFVDEGIDSLLIGVDFYSGYWGFAFYALSITEIQFFISCVKLSGILGLATIYKNTKNYPLVSDFEWVWQHNFQAFAKLLLWDKFLHRFFTSFPSILLSWVFSLPQRTSNSLILIASGFYFYLGWGGGGWGFCSGGDWGGAFFGKA